MSLSKFGGGSPVPLSKLLNPANFNNVMMRKWKHRATDISSTSSTWISTIKAPAAFSKVRLIHQSISTTPGSVFGALVAVTANPTDKVTPTTGTTITNDAGATGHSRVTYNGANTANLPACGSDTTNDPGYLISDWIDMDSIASNDGSGNFYLQIRQKFTGHCGYFWLESTTHPSYTDITKSTYHISYTFNGDGITNPAAINQGMCSNDQNTTLFAVEFMVDHRVMRVLMIGDSISMGSYDSGYPTYAEDPYGISGRCNDYFMANNIPINVINDAWSSKTTSQFSIWGKRSAETLLPSMAIYSVFSPNDTTITQAIANTQYRRAMDFAAYCIQYGVLPVFSFIAPVETYNLATDNIRKALIARVKTSGFEVIDTTSILGDGASPQQFIPAYRSETAGQGIHPSGAGYTAAMPSFRDKMLDIYHVNVS